MRPVLTTNYKVACAHCRTAFVWLPPCPLCRERVCGNCRGDDDICILCAMQRDKKERDDEAL